MTLVFGSHFCFSLYLHLIFFVVLIIVFFLYLFSFLPSLLFCSLIFLCYLLLFPLLCLIYLMFLSSYSSICSYNNNIFFRECKESVWKIFFFHSVFWLCVIFMKSFNTTPLHKSHFWLFFAYWNAVTNLLESIHYLSVQTIFVCFNQQMIIIIIIVVFDIIKIINIVHIIKIVSLSWLLLSEIQYYYLCMSE